jgi:hypothetical protein
MSRYEVMGPDFDRDGRQDPLAAWRANPFFVLEVPTQASRAEIERAGQKLLALLALGSVSAESYQTPLGPGKRDADDVRQALATLREPNARVLNELWANIADTCDDQTAGHAAKAWEGCERLLGWTGKWPR